ncbi:MAG: hypothetical protein ACFNUG_10315, partial [Tannerella forsythia]|uniref:hypothetical protein n=1 Tax=Tannerella forsythia TaxID=28112 RepID=UPI00361E7C9A
HSETFPVAAFSLPYKSNASLSSLIRVLILVSRLITFWALTTALPNNSMDDVLFDAADRE